MDHFNSRDHEEDMFDILRQPEGGPEVGGAEDNGAEDGSQFLNESGPGMELARRDEAQTSFECDDDSQNGGHPQSGEVYSASGDQMH